MSEPALLFSPLPEPEPDNDALTGTRDADSVLFQLNRSPQPEATSAAPPLGDRESSGLVDVRDLISAEPDQDTPAAASSRESSGLVDVAQIVAAEESRQRPATIPPLSLVAAAVAPTAEVSPQDATPAAAAKPAIPTPVLMAVIITLLGALAALAWKIGATS